MSVRLFSELLYKISFTVGSTNNLEYRRNIVVHTLSVLWQTERERETGNTKEHVQENSEHLIT